jgi:hypothetical protein
MGRLFVGPSARIFHLRNYSMDFDNVSYWFSNSNNTNKAYSLITPTFQTRSSRHTSYVVALLSVVTIASYVINVLMLYQNIDAS